MRLLYALDTFRPNIDGVAISSERIARGLARRGHAVAVVAPGRRFADYEEVVDGLPVYRIRALKVLSDRWRIPVLPGDNVKRAMYAFRPDIVVVTLPFLLSRVAVAAAGRLRLPVVGVTGTMPEWLTSNLPLPRGLAQRANPAIWRHIASYYNQCSAVVGVSNTALRLLQDHGLERPGYVISNGVSLRRFRPRPRDEELASRLGVDNKPVVLYAGRIDPEKRLDLWLEAAYLVLQSGFDAQFLIVGDGAEVRQMSHLAEKLGIAAKVKFAGFLGDADYPRVFSLADVFAISSPAELQSIVTLEAAASGLPLVAVNAGALPELVEDGGNGFLFALDDAEEMAGAVQRLLVNPSLRAQMGRGSRMIAVTHDIERTIEGYERLFRQVARQNRGDWRMRWPSMAEREYSSTRGA